MLVQVIDVLGAQEQTIRHGGFEARESEMGGIGPGGGSHAAAHGVKVPDEARVAAPGEGRGHLFEAVVAPQAAGIAKRGDSAFGADTGTGGSPASAGLPGGSNTIIVGVWMLEPGEDAIVAERLYEVLKAALS